MSQNNRDYWVGKFSAYFIAFLVCIILGYRTIQFERKSETLPLHEYLIGVFIVSNALSVQINVSDIGSLVLSLLGKKNQ